MQRLMGEERHPRYERALERDPRSELPSTHRIDMKNKSQTDVIPSPEEEENVEVGNTGADSRGAAGTAGSSAGGIRYNLHMQNQRRLSHDRAQNQ